VLDFWLWFQRRGFQQPDDQLRVEVSGDGGASWLLVERINDIDFVRSGRWAHQTYHLNAWLAPQDGVRVRLRVRDIGLDANVEALLDDLRVYDAVCDCGLTRYCVTTPNSAGPGARIDALGSTSLAANDLVLTVAGAAPGKVGLFFYGPGSTQSPLGDGTLCVAGGSAGIQRLQPPLLLDAQGAGARALDHGALPQPPAAGAVTAGSSWRFQFWYRDPQGGPAGSNLSDALLGVFCP